MECLGVRQIYTLIVNDILTSLYVIGNVVSLDWLCIMLPTIDLHISQSFLSAAPVRIPLTATIEFNPHTQMSCSLLAFHTQFNSPFYFAPLFKLLNISSAYLTHVLYSSVSFPLQSPGIEVPCMNGFPKWLF